MDYTISGPWPQHKVVVSFDPLGTEEIPPSTSWGMGPWRRLLDCIQGLLKKLMKVNWEKNKTLPLYEVLDVSKQLK